ncbi:CLUMA_CG012855, isoform A [Clunio marinus]|uniref:CLUMA_CG012855, isoform A n=1 Tax=Clunio marinus TaxID=568069 RepID=A0A1J1IH54_9DIPT|nr:CLUMA_CG012855, isoform A [Clunio marinus]
MIEAKECPEFCIEIYKPVCGAPVKAAKYDTIKTFPNDCYLGVHNCRNPNKTYKKIWDYACEASRSKVGK